MRIANHAPELSLGPWLERIRAVARDESALLRLLSDLPIGVLPSAPRAGAGASYGRALLHCGDGVEVMQAGWACGARAEPHDHGPATGAVVIMAGCFREQVWRLVDGELLRGPEHRHQAGDVMRVQAGLVHSLEALSEGCTLHVYAPPVTGMRVYDRSAREVLELSDGHGAWLPREAHQVQARYSFHEACHARR